jgi:hypothetical protein
MSTAVATGNGANAAQEPQQESMFSMASIGRMMLFYFAFQYFLAPKPQPTNQLTSIWKLGKINSSSRTAI